MKENRYKILIVSIFVILLLMLVFFGYQYFFDKGIGEIGSIKTRMSSVVDVDVDEDPTIIEIKDIDKVKDANPMLYTGAENGDVMVFYSNKVIIYREREDRIINVLPILDNIEKDNNLIDLEEKKENDQVNE